MPAESRRQNARLRSAVGALTLVLALFAGCRGRTKERPSALPARPPARDSLSILFVTIDTLRPDHLGAYGYSRATSPNIDALARNGTLFERAFTYWPKTRGSFVSIMTGRRASQTGYGKTHPLLLAANPTLASVLQAAGYDTAAIVDNANVAASLGFSKGFRSYRETWEEKALSSEMDRTRAITAGGVAFLKAAQRERPFLLWLHYVNPHAPYTPPAPYDTRFLDERAAAGPRLPVVSTLHGGIPQAWAVPGHDRLGYYVAQYDGEIAAVDEQVGQLLAALASSAVAQRTMVVLASDHGESLGEHDYYFDHGENLFDPCQRIPLIVRLPSVAAGRRPTTLASTLDLMPTMLDAANVSYPPDLAGRSLLPEVRGRASAGPARLYGQNERNLAATWDQRYKLVATPTHDGHRFALYDRQDDPGETKDVAPRRPDALRANRRELELFFDIVDGEWARIRASLSQTSGVEHLSPEACERLKALGYAQAACK
jgi:arylsulfatase A-like enzyme